MDRHTALIRAQALREKCNSPFGTLPLERVISSDLDLFAGMRAAGASWRSIAAVMAEAGFARPDGAPLPPSQWSAMISRALRARAKAPSAPAGNLAVAVLPPGRSASSEFIAPTKTVLGPVAERRDVVATRGPAAAPGLARDGEVAPAEANPPPVEATREQSAPTGSTPNAVDVRARMRRARTLREL